MVKASEHTQPSKQWIGCDCGETTEHNDIVFYDGLCKHCEGTGVVPIPIDRLGWADRDKVVWSVHAQLERLWPGEPAFVIRANDPIAVPLLRMYLELSREFNPGNRDSVDLTPIIKEFEHFRKVSSYSDVNKA